MWLYWQILSNLVISLAENEDYSYGLLLPLVSGYVVYLKWPQLRRWRWGPSWAGLLIIAFGLCLDVLGELAAELYTTRLSFTVVLAGILFLVGSWSLVRTLSFPLVLLVLMLPLPELITYKLTLPLQLISSSLAVWILQILGVPVVRQGNIIDLGVRQLQVVAACSGLRPILSLLASGLVYCYFFQRRPWKVAVLLAALIPAVILFNALRLAGLALLPGLEVGFWHACSSWVVFLLCLAILALINRVLNRLWPQPVWAHKDLPVKAEGPAGPQNRELGRYLLAAWVLVFTAIPLLHHMGMAASVPLRQSFDHFPMALGPWQGQPTQIEPAMVEATKSDAQLSADYKHAGHDLVNLWITYYETQKKAGGFVHSPKGCFTANGWKIMESREIQIGPGLPVNCMLVDQMGTQMLVFYWFMQRGRWLASEYANKLSMGYDGLMHRRTDGALIRLITPAGAGIESARQRLSAFADFLIPVLPQFIPD
jgi:exosortase D (VPLPA-CTERM-specific)